MGWMLRCGVDVVIREGGQQTCRRNRLAEERTWLQGRRLQRRKLRVEACRIDKGDEERYGVVSGKIARVVGGCLVLVGGRWCGLDAIAASASVGHAKSPIAVSHQAL